MAEEYQQQQSHICSQNWWSNNNSTTNYPSGQRISNRYESGSGTEDPLAEHDMNKVGMIRLEEDSVSVSASSPSSMMFLNTNLKMLPGTAPGSILSSRDDGSLLIDANLQHMGLALSSQGLDWDQALHRGGKADQSSFRSMLEENHHISSSANFQQEIQWKPNKIFSTTIHGGEEQPPSLSRSGLISLDQPQFSSPNEDNSTITCHNYLPSSYIESPSSMLQSFNLGPNNINNQPQHEHQQQAFFDQRVMDDEYSYSTTNYGMNSNESQFMPPSSFSSDNVKFPQFVRNSSSSPKQQQQQQQQQPLLSQNHLHFSNNAPYWNASSARVVPDIRASFMPSLQPPQFPTSSTNSSFEKKPKNNIKEVNNKDSSMTTAKKSGAEASTKRPRNESSSPSTLPSFKVKKEKMGDRITTLQQLVSPFGKTDTASVLSESIEYIKILHEQVLVLTAPYMKNGAMVQPLHHQHLEKSTSRDSKGPKQDLRSRGLCLIPLSSTFQLTHETSVDFWTPTFGGPLQ